jgi:hypothetical protein
LKKRLKDCNGMVVFHARAALMQIRGSIGPAPSHSSGPAGR